MPEVQNPFKLVDLHDDDARLVNNEDTDSLGDIDDKTLKQQVRVRYSQDTLYRKHLAKWVMWIVPCWLIAVILVLAFNWLLNLDSSVLISLLATTTVNVLGLAYIVLKGIFPQK